MDKVTELRDALVHHIYGLVNDSSQWRATASSLDCLIASSCAAADADALSEQMDSMHPHLQQVDLLLNQIHRLRAHDQQTESAFEHIPMGMAILDAQGRVLQTNVMARTLLDHLQAEYNSGILHFKKECNQLDFSKALRLITKSEIHAVPFRVNALKLCLTAYAGHNGGCRALYFGHSSLRKEDSVKRLKIAYELTTREAQITYEMCYGKACLNDAAAVVGINVSTARSHLKHVFSKTKTSRQAELVQLVLTNPQLNLESAPGLLQAKENRTLRLAKLISGRTVSYAEYGCPIGKPVLMCHAMTGSRLCVPSDHAVLETLGIRLIVPDRPGYGHSTPASKAILQQWMEDMSLFIPQLGIAGCTVLAWSAGAPYAMQLAAEKPELVADLCLVSSATPIRDSEYLNAMLPLSRMMIHLAKNNVSIAKAFIKVVLKSIASKGGAYHEHLYDHLLPADEILLQDECIQKVISSGFEEAINQGQDAICNELIFIARDWHIEPNSICCPTTIWHGFEDLHAPIGAMKQFCQSLDGPVQSNLIQNSGHYLMFSYWPQIMKSLTAK